MIASARVFLIPLLAICVFVPVRGHAAPADADADGLLDIWETKLFFTDPAKADTDGDGFPDATEVGYGFSPLDAKSGARLQEADHDKDGVSDAREVSMGTDPMAAPAKAKTPTAAKPAPVAAKLVPAAEAPLMVSLTTTTAPVVGKKSLLIDLSDQRLYQKIDDVIVGTFVVSSGKARTPTPVGTFKIETKSPKAWSGSAKLWMPYWMGFKRWTYGIHELPEWPGGKKEGKEHLGIPVSHGCVRVGEVVAKTLYEWTPIGTPVTIQR